MAIDLSKWNWTSPVGAKVTQTADLNKRIPNAFLKFNADGSITFRAPSSGDGIQSTPNSTYPRSELRQTLENGDDKEANWKPSAAPQSMYAELSVDELASSKKAIIGQIHGDGDHPPLKIQITGTTVYAQLRQKLNGPEVDPDPVLGTVVLGQRFTYQIDMKADYSCDIYFNGVLKIAGYQFDKTSYKNDTWYWKAGMYSQEVVGGSGTGQSTFYALTVGPFPAVVVPPVVTPPVVTPPVVTPPVVTPPPARTLANVSADVAAQLNTWRADHSTSKAVQDAIQVLKLEADTFPQGTERSAVYTAITAARTEIRAVPPVVVDPPVDNSLSGQIAAIVKANAAGTMTASAAKSKLNDIGDDIDEMDDGPEQTALYTQLKAAVTGLK